MPLALLASQVPDTLVLDALLDAVLSPDVNDGAGLGALRAARRQQGRASGRLPEGLGPGLIPRRRRRRTLWDPHRAAPPGPRLLRGATPQRSGWPPAAVPLPGWPALTRFLPAVYSLLPCPQ
jgi:hypothetical protein